MTLSEFKAWFEGFTEGMEAAPDEKQWERIKARVKEIDGVAVTKTVFVDHYYPPYRPYWSSQRLDVFGAAPSAMGIGSNAVGAVLSNAVASAKAINSEFESHCAMIDLGKAEYRAALNG